MTDRTMLTCGCGAVGIAPSGTPRVRGHCHCSACRRLLDVPYHSVTIWDAGQVEITRGEAALSVFQHPSLSMKKVFCPTCGEVIYTTNAMDWRVVSQRFIAKNTGGTVPEALAPLSHFHCASRIVDVADDLPKKD